jgi:SAM-dependent methyltransferase
MVMPDDLYNEKWIDLYDLIVPERHYSDSFCIIMQAIKRHCHHAKDVLELACGSGRYTRYFAKQGFRVKGTDISNAALKKASKRVHSAKFVQADMSSTQEHEHYDVVACLYEAFRYNEDHAWAQKTIGAAYESLKKGGLFLVDFAIYPAGKGSVHVVNDAKTWNGKYVMEYDISWKGHYDVRENCKVTVTKKGLFGKKVHEFPIIRGKLLRISENEMEHMLKAVGFSVVDKIWGFQEGNPKSVLFVAQK